MSNDFFKEKQMAKVITINSRVISETIGIALDVVHLDIKRVIHALGTASLNMKTWRNSADDWEMTPDALGLGLKFLDIEGCRGYWTAGGKLESIDLPEILALELAAGYGTLHRNAIYKLISNARDQQAAEKVVASKPPVVSQVVSPGVVTMSSLELVEFINSQRGDGEAVLAHSDFLKKVPQVLGKDAGNFSSIYRDSMNREKPCFNFPKREACLMAMSYSYELQAKVFDRMTELEGGAAKPQHVIPQTLTEALRLAADLADARDKAQAQLAVAEPKAKALDLIAGSDGGTCMTDAAKSLAMGPRKLIAWLSANRWIYRRAGGKGWVAYQDRLQAGLLDHKVGTVVAPDGSTKMTEQVLVTPKGLAKLAKQFTGFGGQLSLQ